MNNLNEVDIQKEYLPNPNPWAMFFRVPGKEIAVTIYPPKDFSVTVDKINLIASYFLQGKVPQKATNE
ncbi:hypothetical protein [Acinetobacter gerneri]|uniref:hypothetical protein n=1 Tax=Acinetobacter gerneri TaxID=202952 RepID=UPI0028AAB42E|nr:hypothetical protein [Acinetobacter gerneri]